MLYSTHWDPQKVHPPTSSQYIYVRDSIVTLTYNIEETTHIPCNCMVIFLVNSLVLQITYIEPDSFN